MNQSLFNIDDSTSAEELIQMCITIGSRHSTW